MIKKSTGVILVNAFSRAENLENCLEAIRISNRDFRYPLILVRQLGVDKVGKVIESYKDEISHLFEFKSENRTPLENINLNRIVGYQIGFDWVQADWVLAIEEDIEISYDAVSFVSSVFDQLSSERSFRGINLGSKIPKDDSLMDSYSKIRYGLHGQASAITRKTWKKFNVEKLIRGSSEHGLDSQLEFYLKTGFMCTPNLSRYRDTGWNGTHSSPNPNDDYYLKLNESWIGSEKVLVSNYQFDNIEHAWRKDSVIFNRYESIYYHLKFYANKWLQIIKRTF